MKEIEGRERGELRAKGVGVLNEVGNILRKHGKLYESVEFYKKAL